MIINWQNSIQVNEIENSARRLADWICRNQYKIDEWNAFSGNVLWMADPEGKLYPGNNWNCGFSIMGLLKAAKYFQSDCYFEAAVAIGNYLKSLQIFSPFLKNHYGAIRELSPQCPWCYTRDALSAAWGFLALYQATRTSEYLERAELWAEWFFKNGMDETGWPKWGIYFEAPFPESVNRTNDELHGCFQGGGLNFFENLYRCTNNSKYVGAFYQKIADTLVDEIQQPGGYFISVNKTTRKPPEVDPQGGLHRANDDLCTLGLLGAYRIYPEQRYLDSVHKFLTAVFAKQAPDGSFEQRCAATPVILNTVWECEHAEILPDNFDAQSVVAMKSLLARQFPDNAPSYHAGALNENLDDWSCSRSACYTLLFWLKILNRQK